MTKGKQFVLDSIKMDLHRVITASGDITKELPVKSIITFLKHADKDFNKTSLTAKEKSIKRELKILAGELNTLSDPHKRLRWTENIMTARCRL